MVGIAASATTNPGHAEAELRKYLAVTDKAALDETYDSMSARCWRADRCRRME
jgi:hypothetical protein